MRGRIANMKNKIKEWFTLSRCIVYGTLSGIVLLGAVIVTLSTGFHAVGRQIERADSCAFERWYAPKDQVRSTREDEIYFALLKTQYLMQEMATRGMKLNADSRFKQDSITFSWRHR